MCVVSSNRRLIRLNANSLFSHYFLLFCLLTNKAAYNCCHQQLRRRQKNAAAFRTGRQRTASVHRSSRKSQDPSTTWRRSEVCWHHITCDSPGSKTSLQSTTCLGFMTPNYNTLNCNCLPAILPAHSRMLYNLSPPDILNSNIYLKNGKYW